MTIGFADAVGVTHWTTAAPNTRGKTPPCTVVQRRLALPEACSFRKQAPPLGSSRHAHAMGRQCASHPTPQSCLFPERRTTGGNTRGHRERGIGFSAGAKRRLSANMGRASYSVNAYIASGRVSSSDILRISGAARTTMGNIKIHATSHDCSKWRRKIPSFSKFALVIAAVIALVRPD